MEQTTRDQFGRRVREVLDERRVGRDHPVHRMYLEGRLTRPLLLELGRQQWAFHRSFPGNLALLAGSCPDPTLRRRLLEEAYEQETGAISGTAGRVAQWERVCESWGLTPNDLASATVLPETDAMIATQELVVRRSFGEGAAGLLIAVGVEMAPFMQGRRQAMADAYGVMGPALEYFSAQVQGDPLDEYVDLMYPFNSTPRQQEAALRAIRLVLHARWEYFSGIGRASGLTGI